MVCVFSTTAAPDYGQPWALYAEEDVTGSGFWVSPTQVVTNEHVIKHARDVRVRPHGSARKLKCRVAFASAERDLALLEVIDDAMSPPVLNFAQSLPELYSAVAVVGYPLGGDNICVTRGVVSRLDAMAYGGEGRGERLVAAWNQFLMLDAVELHAIDAKIPNSLLDFHAGCWSSRSTPA